MDVLEATAVHCWPDNPLMQLGIVPGTLCTSMLLNITTNMKQLNWLLHPNDCYRHIRRPAAWKQIDQ
jgi:hypothetical protein